MSDAVNGVIPSRGAFVVGVARSGTSLLKALLDGHPEVMALPRESFASDWCGAADPVAGFFRASRFEKICPPGSEEHARLERGLRERLDGPTDIGTAIRSLYEVGASIWPPPEGARVWIEKTPRHHNVVPILMRRVGQGTRVVCVVRDPRGVFASQAKRWERTEVRHVRHFCRRWVTADRLTAHYVRRYTSEVLAIRYEDLVLATEASMRRVARHLDLTWDDMLLTPTKTGEAWTANSSFGDGTTGVSSRPLERWRDSLDADTVALIERLTATRMLSWGYEVSTPKVPGGGLQRVALEAVCLGRELRARRRWAAEESAGVGAGGMEVGE